MHTLLGPEVTYLASEQGPAKNHWGNLQTITTDQVPYTRLSRHILQHGLSARLSVLTYRSPLQKALLARHLYKSEVFTKCSCDGNWGGGSTLKRWGLVEGDR